MYFTFGTPARRSTEFGVYNVSVSGGLYEEQISASKTINEVTIRGNDKPYHIDVKKEPKKFTLHFSLLEKMEDDVLDDIIRWLDVDFYEPLFFSGNNDRVFYAMPVEGINYIHNGLKEGYLSLTMRCDSPYSYSHEQVTPWYEFIKGLPTAKTTIDINNLGHRSFLPEIWISKVGDGNISIHNLNNGSKVMKFTNLKDKEEVYIDGENQIIESSLPNTWRFDDFNDEYLEIKYGKNRLKIDGEARIRFRYKFIYA